MTSRLTRWLLLASVAVGGLTSGLNRAVVDTPAWQRLGAQAWADFSRHADLGPGVLVYSLENIPHAILALAAAVSFRLDRRAPRSAGLPIYLAAVSMLGIMATTAKAAPIMFRVGHLGDNQQALRDAFHDFTLWGVYVRGAFTVTAFLTAVWAVGSFLLPPRRGPAPTPPTGRSAVASTDASSEQR